MNGFVGLPLSITAQGGMNVYIQDSGIFDGKEHTWNCVPSGPCKHCGHNDFEIRIGLLDYPIVECTWCRMSPECPP